MAAGFFLDAGLNVDSGTGGVLSADNQKVASTNGGLVFNRRSTVSLVAQDLGELRLGRDFVPTYWNLTSFDPFGTAGAGAVTNIAQGALTRVSTVQTAVRASNSIGYFLPSLSGVYGQVMYALGENPSNAAGGTKDDGRYVGGRVGYAAGPVNVAAAYATTSLASGNVSTTNTGASNDLGTAKLMAQYFRDSKGVVAAPSKSYGWMRGAQVNIGAGYIPLSYSTVRDDSGSGRSARQVAVGYVYNLSKRTAVYTTYSHIQNRNEAALSGGGVPGG